MNNAVKINRAAVRAADRRRNTQRVGTNAQIGSPCARCRKTACPNPCYPHLDWNRRHRETPATSGKTPARATPATPGRRDEDA